MKLYIDFTGKFQMYIPINWEYKNPSLYRKTEPGTPQAFGMYNKSLGAFQISCKPITDHIQNLIETRREPRQTSDSEKLIFSEQYNSTREYDVYVFSCVVDDHYLFATYVVTPEPKLIRKIEIELSEVREVLLSVKFIPPQFREIIMSQRRMDLFMSATAAVMKMKNEAIDKGAFLEYIVLSANHIDALLRISIILNEQIIKSNREVDVTLLFQGEDDRVVMERTIYKRCLDLQIIDQSIFNKLEELYTERNKVIHRYIITDIRTEDIYKIAAEYEEMYEKIDRIIFKLEATQVEKKIGSWGDPEKTKLTDIHKEILLTKIRDKQGQLPKKRKPMRKTMKRRK